MDRRPAGGGLARAATASSRSSASKSKERLRRIEHEVFSVLKAVFLGGRGLPGHAPRRRELGAAAARPARRAKRGRRRRARSSTGCWTTTTSSWASCATRFGPDGRPHARLDETALGVFTDPTLLPVVFPGLMEEIETHLAPAPRATSAIIDIDYCNNAQAIHHLEPIDDVVIREWGADGKLQGVDAAARPLRQGRLHRSKPQRHPAAARRSTTGCSSAAATSQNSHAYRETRALFNRFPQARAASTPTSPTSRTSSTASSTCRATTRSRCTTRTRPGLRGPLRRLLARALLVPRSRRTLRAALARGLRPDLLQHLGRPGRGHPARLLLRPDRARAPDRPGGGPRASSSALVTTWEDRVGVSPRADVRRSARAGGSSTRYVPQRVAQRPLPRGRRRPSEVPGGPAAASRRSRAGSRSRVIARHRRVGDAEALLGAPARPHRHLRTLAEPRRSPSPRSCAIPLTLPDGRRMLPLPLRDRGRRRRASRRWSTGEERFVRGAARARRGARHRRSAERPDPARRA